MKQLTCEMCGSTDLVKQDGIFVCQTAEPRPELPMSGAAIQGINLVMIKYNKQESC